MELKQIPHLNWSRVRAERISLWLSEDPCPDLHDSSAELYPSFKLAYGEGVSVVEHQTQDPCSKLIHALFCMLTANGEHMKGHWNHRCDWECYHSRLGVQTKQTNQTSYNWSGKEHTMCLANELVTQRFGLLPLISHQLTTLNPANLDLSYAQWYLSTASKIEISAAFDAALATPPKSVDGKMSSSLFKEVLRLTLLNSHQLSHPFCMFPSWWGAAVCFIMRIVCLGHQTLKIEHH